MVRRCCCQWPPDSYQGASELLPWHGGVCYQWPLELLQRYIDDSTMYRMHCCKPPRCCCCIDEVMSGSPVMAVVVEGATPACTDAGTRSGEVGCGCCIGDATKGSPVTPRRRVLQRCHAMVSGEVRTRLLRRRLDGRTIRGCVACAGDGSLGKMMM
jgi:hypothetical protein